MLFVYLVFIYCSLSSDITYHMLYLRATTFLYHVIKYANPIDADFNMIGSEQKHILNF